MIIKGNIGKLTIRFLTKFPVFNRHFKVVRLGDTFKIFQSQPIAKLKDTEITTSNFLSLKFDIYDSFKLLKEHTAQVEKLDEERKQLILNVWDSEQMNSFIKRFSLSLTDRTFTELKELLDKKVFNEKVGDEYKYFISVWLQKDIKKATHKDRKFSEGTLKYSLKSATNRKEKRLKSKFRLTKQEAITFCSNISYWSDN